MASMTRANDTVHNQRARELHAAYTNELLSERERRAASDELFYMFEQLAYSYARKIIPRWDENNRADIQQTAALALCCARDMWNPDRGPFAVILMYAIKNEMRDWLRNQDMVVRSHRTFHEHARQVKEGEDSSSTARVPVVSLDGTTGPTQNANKRLLEMADTSINFAEDLTLKHAVRQVVNRLPAAEGAIVANYYGLNGAEPKTLRETADIVGRSHETVRQALSRAHRTIRNCFHGYA